MYTLTIKNISGSIQTWAGKEFAIDELYNVPADANRIKWQTSSALLTAIGAGDAEIGNGDVAFSDINAAISYLKGLDTRPVDSDGAPITKQKIVPEGWAYQLRGFDIELGQLTGLLSVDAYNATETDVTIAHYDAQGTLITTQQDMANAVKSIVAFEPVHDYAIVGGIVYQTTTPASNVRLGVIAAPYVPKNMGGNVEFGAGINLKYIDKTGAVNMDGRNPKILTYDATYHTSMLHICLYYPAGITHSFHLLFEVFNPPGV